MKHFASILLLIFCSLLVRAQDHTLFVAENGRDGNPGSIQQPLKTLDKALALAKQFSQKDVTIEMRGGIYYLDKTLDWDGAEGLPASLLIRPYQHEKVTISAGRRLRLDWKPYRNGILRAVVPAGIVFERLYIDGRLQPMARYPNYDPGARVFHGTAADALSPERVKRWKDPTGGYVHALHESEWGGFHYRITGVDSAGKLQLTGGWQNNRPAGMHSTYRFVENVFEELDSAGEWWLDREKHLLYYLPPAGTDPRKMRVEVSHLENSIELHGSPGRPVKGVHLQGLRFVQNERSFMDTKEPLLRSDWTIYRGGAVLFDGTEDCTIRDCDFTGLGGNAIMLSNYNRRDTISGCLVAEIGANAVCFVGDPKAVRSPSFRYELSIPYEQLDKTPGPLTNNYPQQCLVDNNLFHDLGDIEKQATGVLIEMASAIKVSHNSIYNTPRAGINIGDGCWGGHEIAYNDVFNTVLQTGDHGSFNSWGRDRYWYADRGYMDSLAAVHPELPLLDVQQTITIHDNRWRCDHGWDIDLDDGSTNYHIYNNLCLNGGLKLREGFDRTVENNVLINNSFHPHVWFAKSGDVFQHNIVLEDYHPIQVDHWGEKIDYNLFPDTAALAGARGRGTDVHSAAGNPLFRNAGGGDYTVSPGSPALALGFRNFSMDSFGVVTPRLARMALRAPIPVLRMKGMTGRGEKGGTSTLPFLGGIVRDVEGLGDRSAFGLPDETGVIVVEAPAGSLLANSGVREKDVVIGAGKLPVKGVKALQAICATAGWHGKLEIMVFRNQQKVKLALQLQ